MKQEPDNIILLYVNAVWQEAIQKFSCRLEEIFFRLLCHLKLLTRRLHFFEAKDINFKASNGLFFSRTWSRGIQTLSHYNFAQCIHNYTINSSSALFRNAITFNSLSDDVASIRSTFMGDIIQLLKVPFSKLITTFGQNFMPVKPTKQLSHNTKNMDLLSEGRKR